MNSRLIMSLISLLFFGPFIFAWTYFFYGNHTQHTIENGSNKGHIIAEPIRIASQIETINNKKKWSLVVVSPTCESSCEANLHKLKQLRLIFAKDMRRIQRVLMTENPVPDAIPGSDSDSIQHIIDHETSQMLLSQLDVPTSEGGIFIRDPRGFMIMSYSLSVDPDDIFSDLTHLLKYSHIG